MQSHLLAGCSVAPGGGCRKTDRARSARARCWYGVTEVPAAARRPRSRRCVYRIPDPDRPASALARPDSRIEPAAGRLVLGTKRRRECQLLSTRLLAKPAFLRPFLAFRRASLLTNAATPDTTPARGLARDRAPVSFATIRRDQSGTIFAGRSSLTTSSGLLIWHIAEG